MRTLDDIARDIAAFEPPGDSWLPLDALLVELFTTDGDRARALPTLFGVFERFPDSDGYGVFWTLIHGIESIAGYETELDASLARRPTDLTERMRDRLRRAR